MKKYLVFLAAALLAASVSAQTYKAIVGDIPGTETLEEVIRTIADEAGATVIIEKVPMQRMIATLAAKGADMGVPMLAVKDKDQQARLPVDYSTEPLQKMCFVIYMNKDKPIDVEQLKKGNPKGYKIESDISNAALFSFGVQPSSNPQGSLKKVNDGTIDGYIMGQASIDPVLRALQYKNIRRRLYDTFDIVFALQKGAKNGPVDKLMSGGLKKLKDSGRYDKIMGDTSKSGTFEDWQP